MTTITQLPGEIDWLCDWLDAQIDAGRPLGEVKADSYYQQTMTALWAARQAKWGQCCDCLYSTPTCITEMLATGQQIENCPAADTAESGGDR